MRNIYRIGCFLLLFSWGCADKPYFSVNSIDLRLFDASVGLSWTELSENAQVSAPELVIRQSFSLKYTSFLSPAFWVPSVHAQEAPGSLGLKSPVASITVSSVHLYNGKTPGSSLNEFVTAFTGPQGTGSVEDLVEAINSPGSVVFDYEDVPLYISRPYEQGPQKFRVTIVFENGDQVSGESARIYWI